MGFYIGAGTLKKGKYKPRIKQTIKLQKPDSSNITEDFLKKRSQVVKQYHQITSLLLFLQLPQNDSTILLKKINL